MEAVPSQPVEVSADEIPNISLDRKRDEASELAETGDGLIYPGKDYKLPERMKDFQKKFEEMEKEVMLQVKEIEKHRKEVDEKKSQMTLLERAYELQVQMDMNRQKRELIDKVEGNVKEFVNENKAEFQSAKNPHEQMEVIHNIIKLMLQTVDDQIPKVPFKNIDNTPKHLMHITDEDIRVKSPEQLREELTHLVNEAKSKIKPVMMTQMDRDQYILSKEEFEKRHDGVTLFKIDPEGMRLLDEEGITLEILRKIQDKKYEIDLEYEKTRDLFEKQRVVDQFLEEHQEDNLVLHGYFQNKYHEAKLNNYLKFIYKNSYDVKSVRFGFFSSTLSTVAATVALGLVHPMLCGLMLYDFYLLAAFSTVFLNRTVNMIVLDKDKQHIVLNKVNLFGYETARKEVVAVRDILYTGEVRNDYLTFDNVALPPSINKILAANNKKLEKDESTGDAKSDSVPAEDKDTFKHFVSFMVDNNKYLIPIDNQNFKKSVISEELMNHIIHGRAPLV